MQILIQLLILAGASALGCSGVFISDQPDVAQRKVALLSRTHRRRKFLKEAIVPISFRWFLHASVSSQPASLALAPRLACAHLLLVKSYCNAPSACSISAAKRARRAACSSSDS